MSTPESQVRRITETDQQHAPTEIPGATPSPAPSDTLREAAAKAVRDIEDYIIGDDDTVEPHLEHCVGLILAAVAPLLADVLDGNDQLRDNLDRLEAYVERARDRLCAGKPDEAAKIIEHATDMAENWPKVSPTRDTLRADVARLTAELAEESQLRERLAALLEGVAVAVRGQPAPLTAHDWSRLPAEVATVCADNAVLREMAKQLGSELAAAKRDGERLRVMVAMANAGAALYTDDGELQDATKYPFIDFKRDSVDEIQRKFVERNRAAIDAAKAIIADTDVSGSILAKGTIASYIAACDPAAADRELLAECERALAPFAHPDLSLLHSGNCEGDESPVYGRDSAILRIKDFRLAEELFAKLRARLSPRA